jgi:hypothetical protein
MIALQIDRAGLELIGCHGTACAAVHGLIVDNGLAIKNHSQVAIAQSHIHGLPLTCRFFCRLRGCDATVQAAHVVGVQRPAIGIRHLNLIDAEQIHTAVAALGHIHLEFQVEVFKRLHSLKVAEILMALTLDLDRVIDQHAVLGTPAVGRTA